MTTSPTLARTATGRVAHLLVPGTKTTRCGKDASLMARWAPGDVSSDRRVWPTCQVCRDRRPAPAGGTVETGRQTD